MADIGLSAFSLFFMQSDSFLSYQRSLAEGRKTSNCHTLFGMAKIPTDNHIRSMLDPVHPSHLQGCFDQAVAALGDHGGMKAFQRLDRRTLIALDGTEYFCSQKLGCPHCQTRKRSNGKVEFYHSMLAATIVAPGHNMVLPLMPEFIVKPDGAEKQDCERNAAKRWLAAHGERMKDLRPVYLGDDLFACQPICEAVLSSSGDFLFTAKPESHIALYDFMNGRVRRDVARAQGRPPKTDLPLPLVHRSAAARGQGCPQRQLDRRHHLRPEGQGDLRRRFRHQPESLARKCRRNRRVRQGALENRERDLQRPEKQRLSSRTQFRPRQTKPRHAVRRHEPFGLRVPHHLRLPRRFVDQGSPGQTRPKTLLRTYPDNHRLSRLSRLGNPHDNPDQIKATSRTRKANLGLKSGRGINLELLLKMLSA